MRTLEDELQWRLPVGRFNIGASHYGEGYPEWCRDGEYVEYDDHQKIVNLYHAEVVRLRTLLEMRNDEMFGML